MALATAPNDEKKLPVSKSTSKWDIKMPYMSKKFSSSRIAMGKSPVTKPKKNHPVSTQVTSPVSKKEDITHVPATNVDVPKHRVKPSLRVDIPQYIIPMETPSVSSTPNTPTVPKTEAISPIPESNVYIPKTKAGPVPETQASYNLYVNCELCQLKMLFVN